MVRTLSFVDVSPEAMREALSHMPMQAWQVADGLIEDCAHYRRGEAAAVISGVEDAAGTVARSFEVFYERLCGSILVTCARCGPPSCGC
jgi:hypothetical protein